MQPNFHHISEFKSSACLNQRRYLDEKQREVEKYELGRLRVVVEEAFSGAEHGLEAVVVGRDVGEFSDDRGDADQDGNAQGVQEVQQELFSLVAAVELRSGASGVAEAPEDVESDHVHPEEGVEKAELGKKH